MQSRWAIRYEENLKVEQKMAKKEQLEVLEFNEANVTVAHVLRDRAAGKN